MAYAIESDHPIDCYDTRRKYPFGQMEVGQSIFVLAPDDKKVRHAADAYGGRNGRRFGARKVDGGSRIWRVE